MCATHPTINTLISRKNINDLLKNSKLFDKSNFNNDVNHGRSISEIPSSWNTNIWKSEWLKFGKVQKSIQVMVEFHRLWRITLEKSPTELENSPPGISLQKSTNKITCCSKLQNYSSITATCILLVNIFLSDKIGGEI